MGSEWSRVHCSVMDTHSVGGERLAVLADAHTCTCTGIAGIMTYMYTCIRTLYMYNTST